MNEQLRTIFRREVAALLLYLRQAMLYAEPADQGIVETINRVADERRAWLDRFAETMRDADILPPGTSFPMRYTSLNYLAVRAVLPALLREETAAIDALKQASQHLAAPPWKAALSELLALKESQLAELSQPKPAV